jgi:hypothetical protein
MESSARSTERAQPSGIVSLLTLLPSSGYFPTTIKTESQPRSVATKWPTAASKGVGPKANPSDLSGYTRSES